MPLPRRKFLQGILGAALMTAAAALGLAAPRRARAAAWPRDAYGAQTVDNALKNLYGTSATTPSPDVKVRAPLQAENGAVVPVAVSANLPDVQSISILVEKNPQPLAAHINFLAGAVPYLAVNLKLAASSDVHFIAFAGGKLYSAKHHINVSVGGCS